MKHITLRAILLATTFIVPAEAMEYDDVSVKTARSLEPKKDDLDVDEKQAIISSNLIATLPDTNLLDLVSQINTHYQFRIWDDKIDKGDYSVFTTYVPISCQKPKESTIWYYAWVGQKYSLIPPKGQTTARYKMTLIFPEDPDNINMTPNPDFQHIEVSPLANNGATTIVDSISTTVSGNLGFEFGKETKINPSVGLSYSWGQIKSYVVADCTVTAQRSGVSYVWDFYMQNLDRNDIAKSLFEPSVSVLVRVKKDDLLKRKLSSIPLLTMLEVTLASDSKRKISNQVLLSFPPDPIK